MRFYDAFLAFADGLRAAGQHLVICGDVNTAHTEADIARPKENAKISGFLPEERAWLDDFLSHGYLDTFRMFDDRPGVYSYWDMKSRARDRDVGWRIDYFFVDDGFKDQVSNAWIMQDVVGSDHCPIGIEIDA
jgi:exodeoxyribonuclease-3